MGCKQQKFVYFDVVSRSFGRQKKFIRNFEGASKTVESCILRQLADRWHGGKKLYPLCTIKMRQRPQSWSREVGGLTDLSTEIVW
jgi:hypothetical protein